MLGVAFGGLTSLMSGANLARMGFMAASAAGLYLLNGKKEQGEVARLHDLKVSSSSYGRGIPIVYGTMRVTGNMIWSTDFDEVLTYTNPKPKGGKKGTKKSTPYFEYYANYAMCLCEGPVEELLRVWADSNLIYDKHNPQDPDIVTVGFSRQEGTGGGKSGFGISKKKGNQGGDSGRFSFRFYSGTETQRQDRFMVNRQGSDMVPAHRGMCYLFFERFKLEDFGNRVPTITAEVAVRKRQEITFTTMRNLEHAPDFSIAFGSKAFVDPERYRLYSWERKDNDWWVRIYDLSSNREIRSISVSEINQAHVPAMIERRPSALQPIPWQIDTFIGIAGTGDLVFTLQGNGNSRPVTFLDPNTFIEKSRFGIGSNTTFNTETTIATAHLAVPAAYLTIKIDWESGDAEVVPRRATIIASAGGHFYVFGDDNQPLVYFRVPGMGFADLIVPGEPELDGAVMYIHNNQNGLNASLWQVRWGVAFYEEDELHGGTGAIMDPGTPNLEKPVDPNIILVRHLVRAEDGPQGVYINNPQIIVGAERVVWFERIMWTADPNKAGLWAVSWNPLTQEIDWRERVSPSSGGGPSLGDTNRMLPLPINTSGSVKWYHNNNVWEVDFRMQEIKSYGIGDQDLTGNLSAVTQSLQVYWPARGALIRFIIDPETGHRVWTMMLLDRNTQTSVGIHFIINDLANRVGIPSERVDLTLLDDEEIIGYIIENPTSARGVVEQLAQVFMFDVVESDYRLKAVTRGREHILTIPQDDLGVVDSDTHDYFLEVRQQEIDLPQTVVVSYVNANKDYQTQSQHYRRPRSPMAVMQSRDKLEINLPMALRRNEAKRMAHKVCMSLWSERITWELVLPWKYLPFDPTDVIRFQMNDGLTFEARMMRMDFGGNFSIEATGVTQTPASYTSDAQEQPDGGVVPSERPFTPQTEAYAANIPYLQDSDHAGDGGFLFYWGSGALGPGFRGALVEYQLEGQDWEPINLTIQELVWGSVAHVVPPPAWGDHIIDDQTVITLLPAHPFETENGFTYSWEQIPHSQWPSHQNTIIIGEEIIYFRDVEIGPQGQVFISHLIRGARGTESAAYKHKVNERFCVVNNGLNDFVAPFSTINRNWSFTSFSMYSLLPPFRYEVRMTGASHKPYAPHYFTRSGDTNITISWERRTRMGGELKDGTSAVPLNEEFEAYEIYLLEQPYDPDFFNPNNPATYVRSWLDHTSRSITYTTAMQAEDNFSSGDPIHIVAFQLSTNVGRGFPGYATLWPSILI